MSGILVQEERFVKVVIVNGVPQAGKDLFVSYCKQILGDRCLNISTVDFVKDIAYRCGWDGTKTPENRKFLSDLKQLLVDWNDVPYRMAVQAINIFAGQFQNTDNVVAFVHCREPKEIQKFKDRIGATTLLLRRPEAEARAQSNSSDSDVFNYNYDIELVNNGTLGDLRILAQSFIEQQLNLTK